MQQVREFVNNDFLYYSLISFLFIIALNTFSNFINNFVLLIKNFKVIFTYLFKFIIFIPKIIAYIFISPFLLVRWIKDLIYIKSLQINSSRNKKI